MLPEITHLQYAVLNFLLTGEKSGRDIRRELAKLGPRRSAPSFYQMMARLEDEKLVHGRYIETVIERQRIKERHYQISKVGTVAVKAAREFYNGVKR